MRVPNALRLALPRGRRRAYSAGAISRAASTPAAVAARHSDAAAASGRSALETQGSGGFFQVWLGSAWQDFGATENRLLRRAVAEGQATLRLEARGQVYECDLRQMQQVNLLTGRRRALRVADRPARPATAPAAPLPAAASPLALPGSCNSANCEDVPRWLHVWVPHGPTFASGAYSLVAGQKYNDFPVWRKTGAQGTDCWIYSTPREHWAIGGAWESTAGAGSAQAWIYSPVRHCGLTPDQVPRRWQHNQPEWTTDAGIVFTELADDDVLSLAGARASAAMPARLGRAVCRGAAGIGAVVGVSGGVILAGDAVFGDGDLADALVDGGGKAADSLGGSIAEALCSVF